MTTFADNEPLSAALQRYFEDNGFGPDGGYSAGWVDFKLGPVPFPFPNTASRKRAVGIHDLHHIVTGYQTSFAGELEIGAWEVGSGCRDFAAAWVLNLAAMGGGAVLHPKRTFAAFVRGCRCGTLYDEPYDDRLLAESVGSARARLGLAGPAHPAGAADGVRFVGWSALGVALGVTLFLLMLPVAVVMWPVLTLARRAAGGGAPLHEQRQD